ncbi:hypothetical protein [Dyella choica]|uniref:Uncharacterized protein n=1 Tax=Dyella choica TaxID=1927959 RepID=A0A432MAK3_9GAMM|nr:hypothetical protein [Dyella choica]RUL78761.1 hypothetical protein EKH80_02810 [Dyella choica]
MSKKSQDIVGFIANLMPLYTHAAVDGQTCALSMLDGTLVAPIVDPNMDPLDDDGWLTVYWQGNPERRTEVSATIFASQAVLRYIELRSAGLPSDTFRSERDHLAEHFQFKTGATLYFAQGYVESENTARLKRWGGRIASGLASVVAKHFGL